MTRVVNPEELAQSPPGETKTASRIEPTLEMHSGGNDAQIIRAHVNNVARMELSATPQLGLAIDGHLTARDQDLGARKLVACGVREPQKRKQASAAAVRTSPQAGLRRSWCRTRRRIGSLAVQSRSRSPAAPPPALGAG